MTSQQVCGPQGPKMGEEPKEADQKTGSLFCQVASEALRLVKLPPKAEPGPCSCLQLALAQLAGLLGFPRMMVSVQGLFQGAVPQTPWRPTDSDFLLHGSDSVPELLHPSNRLLGEI